MEDHVATGIEQWRALAPELDLTGMEVFGRIYRLARLADLRRAETLKAFALQPGDIDVLAPLFRHPEGLRPRSLRNAMMIGSGTLTPRLDRLERRGLLRRSPDPDDRRGRLLGLTEEGRAVAQAAVTELLEVENDLLAGQPETVRQRLRQDLSGLLASIEGADPPRTTSA